MSNELFSALSDLDGLCAELEDVNNLLTLYDENISSDLAPLRRGETWGDKYLLDRWPLHKSMLSTIRLRLHTICEKMDAAVSKGFDTIKDTEVIHTQ